MPKLAPSAESAVLAWAGIVALITAYVVAYDVWAAKTGHRLMTTQFRDWLHGPVTGPIIFAAWVAVIAGLTYHFLVMGPHR